MAEVRLNLPENTPALTYHNSNPEASVSSTEGVIYNEPTTVEVDNPVGIVTYVEHHIVEVGADIKSRILITHTVQADTLIELEESEYPKAVNVEADTLSQVTNEAQVSADMSSTITSDGHAVSADVSTAVTAHAEVGADMDTEIRQRVTIEASTCRVIVTDDSGDDSGDTIPSNAFVDRNSLFRVQYDTLNEDVSDNPYFDRFACSMKNAALLTRSQSIVKAINELFLSLKAQYATSVNAMQRFNSVIGDYVVDADLRAKYKQLNAANIITALSNMKTGLTEIQTLIGSDEQYDELGYASIETAIVELKKTIDKAALRWEGKTDEEVDAIMESLFTLSIYKSSIESRISTLESAIGGSGGDVDAKIAAAKTELTQAISDLETNLTAQIDSISSMTESQARQIAEDVFNSKSEALEQAMRNLEDNVTSQLDAANEAVRQATEGIATINTLSQQFNTYTENTNNTIIDFERRIETLENSPHAAITQEKLNEFKEEIHGDFDGFTEQVRNDIRVILSALEGSTESGDSVYETLLAYLRTEVDPIKVSNQELNTRVKDLEDRANLETGDIFTVNDICSEQDIREMFDGITEPGDGGYPISRLVITDEDLHNLFGTD